jgi:predicted ATPase
LTVHRYIITGAPGAGKTTILAALRDRGYAAVEEAATDVIAREQALGRDRPSLDAGFIDAIVHLQRDRQQQPTPLTTTVQIFDRSPICTLALAYYLGQPVTPVLAREVDRVVAAALYQPRVFFVHLLGFITPTAARRITLAQSVRFEELHKQAYRDHGFELVDVPVGTLQDRVQLVDRYIRSWSEHMGQASPATLPTATSRSLSVSTS